MVEDKKDRGGAEIPTFFMRGQKPKKRGAEIPPKAPPPTVQPSEPKKDTDGDSGSVDSEGSGDKEE